MQGRASETLARSARFEQGGRQGNKGWEADRGGEGASEEKDNTCVGLTRAAGRRRRKERSRDLAPD